MITLKIIQKNSNIKNTGKILKDKKVQRYN